MPFWGWQEEWDKKELPSRLSPPSRAPRSVLPLVMRSELFTAPFQEEWDKKELASAKEEIADTRKQMETMISKDIYKRDLDTQKNQNTVPTAEQRGNSLQGSEDFYLKAEARIWP